MTPRNYRNQQFFNIKCCRSPGIQDHTRLEGFQRNQIYSKEWTSQTFMEKQTNSNKVLFAGPQVLLLQTYMHLEVFWILSLRELQPTAEFCRSAGWWGVTNKTRQTNTESVMEFLPLLVLCSQVAERRGPQHSYAGAPGEVKFPLDGSIWGALYIPSESTQILLFKKKPDFFNHYRNRDWNRAPKRNGWSFPARSW